MFFTYLIKFLLKLKKYILNSLIVLIVFSIFLCLFLLWLLFWVLIFYIAYYIFYWAVGVEVWAEYWYGALIDIYLYKPPEMDKLPQGALHGEDTHAGFPLYYRQFESLSIFFNDPYM